MSFFVRSFFFEWREKIVDQIILYCVSEKENAFDKSK